MFFRASLAAALIGSSGAASATDPVRQPTGKWVVNFDAAQCYAARNYGTIENPLYLALKLPPMGKVMQVGVLRKGPNAEAEQQRGSIQFDNLEPLNIDLLDYKQPDGRLRTFLINVPLEKLEPVRNASSIRIKTAGLDERFSLSSMAALLKTMDECVTDLRRVWNIRHVNDDQPKVMENAKGNLGRLFDSDDYPTQAIFEFGTGTVTVVILINEQGKVADCSVVATSGVPVLDAQACAVITQRAQFTPAIGFDGRPAKTAYLQKISWRMR